MYFGRFMNEIYGKYVIINALLLYIRAYRQLTHVKYFAYRHSSGTHHEIFAYICIYSSWPCKWRFSECTSDDERTAFYAFSSAMKKNSNVLKSDPGYQQDLSRNFHKIGARLRQ